MERVSSKRSSSSFMSSSLLLILLFLVYFSSDGVMASSNYTKNGKNVSKLELERIQRHLNKINKTPVRSIKSPDGDIIDCIPIDKQPAFDHPLLKNHKIQTLPRFENERGLDNYTASDDGGASWQAWHQAGRCPRGTVAIRRTTVDDILRAKSLHHFGKKKASHFNKKQVKVTAQDDTGAGKLEYAIVRTNGKGKLHGAGAKINVWKPYVQLKSEFSLSQIWVYAETSQESEQNTVEAGWQIDNELFGDTNPRFFVYWTRDNYKDTGCYNLLCSGFIQTNKNVALGGSISPVSTYKGNQFDIILLISKDNSGNWWLRYGDDRKVVGYWPAAILTKLKNVATGADWGGEILNMGEGFGGGHHTFTNMGSGYFPEEGFKRAGYFRNVETVDSGDNLIPLRSFHPSVDNRNCYNLTSYQDGDWGTHFYYGGPGFNWYCKEI